MFGISDESMMYVLTSSLFLFSYLCIDFSLIIEIFTEVIFFLGNGMILIFYNGNGDFIPKELLRTKANSKILTGSLYSCFQTPAQHARENGFDELADMIDNSQVYLPL